ncbi:hypothetical protein [Streptomyces cyanogenus]|nr:hypothetical protein [Streptomyces cyanogenus]
MTGSHSRLATDGRSVALRGSRKGAAGHGHRVTAPIANEAGPRCVGFVPS